MIKNCHKDKVNSLSRRINHSTGAVFQELTGESTGMVKGNEDAFKSAVLLGARKKVKMSEKELARNCVHTSQGTQNSMIGLI